MNKTFEEQTALVEATLNEVQDFMNKNGFDFRYMITQTFGLRDKTTFHGCFDMVLIEED